MSLSLSKQFSPWFPLSPLMLPVDISYMMHNYTALWLWSKHSPDSCIPTPHHHHWLRRHSSNQFLRHRFCMHRRLNLDDATQCLPSRGLLSKPGWLIVLMSTVYKRRNEFAIARTRIGPSADVVFASHISAFHSVEVSGDDDFVCNHHRQDVITLRWSESKREQCVFSTTWPWAPAASVYAAGIDYEAYLGLLSKHYGW